MVALTRKTGSHPYLKMARIVAASLHTNEERLEDCIVERTKWLSANAVILGKVDVLESMESRTLYESSLAQPVPDTTHIRGGHGNGGIPFIQIPGVTSKGMRIKGKTDYLSGVTSRCE